jgi:hypothetical protein
MEKIDIDSLPSDQICKIGDLKGACGHCLLTYPSGGKLLTSSGHWIELVKLDVNAD